MSETNNSSNKMNKIKCPEFVQEEDIGQTEEERQWTLKKEPRPPLPRALFFIIGALLALSFIIGGIWYYRTNLLPEKHYQIANALFKQEKYEEATKHYLRVLKLRPERKDVLYQIAFSLEKTKKIDEAIPYYESHIKLMPNDTKALIRLGWLYFEKGEYEKALITLQNASKKDKKNPDLWNLLSKIKLQSGDKEGAVLAIANFSKYTHNPEEILLAGKQLMNLKAYEEALSAYNRFTDKETNDNRGKHGAMAAKIMMGRPADSKLVIIPGKSIGLVALDATKEEVRKAIGRPNAKIFTKIGGKSALADTDTEIWTYNRKNFRKRSLRIIFVNGKVLEVESASEEYKTENGVGLSNFLLTKNSNKLESRREARNSAVLCLIKNGGLTFYAANLNETGTDAKYKKLRLHKGNISIDNVSGFSLLNLFE